MIRCKEGVKFTVLRKEIWGIFDQLDAAFAVYDKECIITCGTEAHGPDDPHTNGFAVDLRVHHLSDETAHAIFHALRQSLGSRYTVIYEGEGTPNAHIHIQIRREIWRSMP